MKVIKNSFGFTLIELLVVMAIIAILTTIALVSFRNVQIKARDGQRKSDLGQVQRALELYLNDYDGYPISSGGLIKIGTDPALNWKRPRVAGEEFTDGKTVYMKELVGDPRANPNYCYSSDGASYQIYTRLENENDPKCLGGQSMCAFPQGTCNGETIYNYEVSSPN